MIFSAILRRRRIQRTRSDLVPNARSVGPFIPPRPYRVLQAVVHLHVRGVLLPAVDVDVWPLSVQRTVHTQSVDGRRLGKTAGYRYTVYAAF